MSYEAPFTKENLDYYLRELGKEFRRLNGKNTPAEIILIGGASILVNYGFREMTYDMDAIITASSVMKDAINIVGDKFGLPIGWLNSDFVKTDSYSPALVTSSKYYKTFSNILTVRTISAEHLIAMKLKSGRQYKNDLSDIIGILREHQKSGSSLTHVQIDAAVCELYGCWENVSAASREYYDAVMHNQDYDSLLESVSAAERQARDVLIEFGGNHPNELNDANTDEILKQIRSLQGYNVNTDCQTNKQK